VARPGQRNVDEALVTALAGGASAAAAAAKAEVSARTVRRRLGDPAFRAQVDEARAELVRQAVGKLADVGALAGETLADLVREGTGTVKLGAARSILEFMFRGHEVDTLARQVADLKRQVEGLTRGDRGAEERVDQAPGSGGGPPGGPGGAEGPAGGSG
jgi:hypothetical protein